MTAEDKKYLMALLMTRKEHVESLKAAIGAMGDHAFINDGLLNEGALKKDQIQDELDQIQRISNALGEEFL